MKTRVFTFDDVTRIVADAGPDAIMDELIAGLATACEAYDPARIEVPERSGFSYVSPTPGLLEWMPALERGRATTVKLVGYHPDNASRFGLPTILSTLLRFDVDSGHLAAVIDGTLATALRTGAASAVATRILARPDAAVLGLVGCGAQAVTQLHALSRVCRLERVLIFDTDPAAVRSFPARVAGLDLGPLEIRSAAVGDVIADADIVCTATSVAVGEGPVVPAGPMRAHVHVNAVGSDFPGKTELPRALLERSLVCPDARGQAVLEGECQVLQSADIGPELPELVGRAQHYSRFRECATVFDSTGWALEDHVVTDLLLRHGERLGLGTPMQLEARLSDPRDPYGGLAAAVAGDIRRLTQPAGKVAAGV